MNEDWSRFLPTFKKKNLPKRRTPHHVSEKKSYTPFPPAPTPSKLDLQLESGEYFLKQNEIKQKKLQEKKLQAKEKSQAKKLERERLFEAPDEDYRPPETTVGEGNERKGKKKRSLNHDQSAAGPAVEEGPGREEERGGDHKKRKKSRRE